MKRNMKLVFRNGKEMEVAEWIANCIEDSIETETTWACAKKDGKIVLLVNTTSILYILKKDQGNSFLSRILKVFNF